MKPLFKSIFPQSLFLASLSLLGLYIMDCSNSFERHASIHPAILCTPTRIVSLPLLSATQVCAYWHIFSTQSTCLPSLFVERLIKCWRLSVKICPHSENTKLLMVCACFLSVPPKVVTLLYCVHHYFYVVFLDMLLPL